MGKGYSMKAAGAATAEILIYEDVGESWFGGVSAKQFAVDLKALGKVSTINLRINSFGGDVFDGLAIYRQLVDHPATVVAHIDGIAASIASVIAMAGSEIRIAEAGEIMIHDAWGVAIGPAADLRAMADRLQAVSSSIADVYCARTGQSKDQVQSWMAAETTFQSADCINYRFADMVMPNMRVAAKGQLSAKHWRRAATLASATSIPHQLNAEIEINKRRQASLLLATQMRA